MPFVSRLVALDERSGRGGLPIDLLGQRRGDDMVEVAGGDALVRVCRLLACLASHADGLFKDIVDECQRVADRTKRLDDRLRAGLADHLAQLDAKTAARPRRRLSANGDDCAERHQTLYGYECQLVTASSRSDAVLGLYATAEESPGAVILECDAWRTDGLTGAKLFSPSPMSIHWNDAVDDDSVMHNNPIVRSLHRRLSRRRRPSPADEGSLSSLWTQSTPEAETTPQTTRFAVVAVDVTGAVLARQRVYWQRHSETSPPQTVLDDNDLDHSALFASVLRRHRPPISRPSPSTRPRSYGFPDAAANVQAVLIAPRAAVDAVTTANRRRATSETREYRHRQSKVTSSISASTTSATTGPQSRGRTTVRQLKRKNVRTPSAISSPATDNSRICSWRHSLCAGFRSSKCDMEDLWASESRPYPQPAQPPSTSSSLTVSVEPIAPVRSQSLPRSFRASFIAPIRRLLSSRSLSSSAADADASCRAADGPSSRASRLYRTSSDSSGNWRLPWRTLPPSSTSDLYAATKVKLVGRSRSLERESSRRTQQQSSVLRTVSLSSRSSTSVRDRKKAGTGSLSSSTGHQVFVDLPGQPWTRPYATVRLRPGRSSDGYQSSSGHWSGDSESTCYRDSCNTVLSATVDEEPVRNDKDSAVCLLANAGTTQLHIEATLCNVADKADLTGVDESSSVVDNQSLYSIDQDGFFTSMHADSGLEVQPINTQNSHVSDSTNVNDIFDVSADTETFSKHLSSDTEDTDTGSITTVTMRVSSLSSTILTIDDKSDSKQANVEQCDRNCGTVSAGKRETSFQDAVRGRVLIGAFPSFCSVTPPSSEDEACTEDTGDRNDKAGQVMSLSTAVSTPLPTGSEKHTCDDDLSLRRPDATCYAHPKVSERHSQAGFFTWPCSPVVNENHSSVSSTPVILDQNDDNGVELISTSSSKNAKQSDNRKQINLPESLLSGTSVVNKPGRGESNDSTLSAGISAALVISAPVVLQSTYVENINRRLVCRPVRLDELHEFSCRPQQSSTLPTNLDPRRGTFNERGRLRYRKRANTENLECRRGQEVNKDGDDRVVDDAVAVSQRNSNKDRVNLMLMRSPRRYGVDGNCKEESSKASNKSAPDKVEEPGLVNYQKVAVKTAVLVKPASIVLAKNTRKMGEFLPDEAPTDFCASTALDCETINNHSNEITSEPCSESDLLPLDSAGVYSLSNGRRSVAQSSESISSVLSAAERTRAAKLAFFGFGLVDEEDYEPVVSPGPVRNHGDCTCSQSRLDDVLAVDSSLSASSSGLGSSVSGSPVVSPDDNYLSTVQKKSIQSKPVSSNFLLSDCTVASQHPHARTAGLHEPAKQTSV